MWRFFNTGYSDGSFNMAFDERLARELPQTDYEGVLRVYGWSPPCISIGFHQSFDTIDLDKCRQEGIDVVRRPTGGRAVLHWEELTYSVVLKTNGESISALYHSIGRTLVRGLQFLHKEIELSRPEPHRSSLPSLSSSTPCYATIARFELQYRGKKVAGSAQRRYQFPSIVKGGKLDEICEVALQHGSILLGPAHQRVVEFLARKEKDVDLLKEELATRSIDLSSILQRRVEFDEVADCIKRGFEEEWGIEFDSSSDEIGSAASSWTVSEKTGEP